MSNPTPTDLKFYWLIAGEVTAANRTDRRQSYKLNAILSTAEGHFTRRDIAHAHEALQRRFVESAPQIPGFKIDDVFLYNVSFLGQQSAEMFHAGFADAQQPPRKEMN